MSSKQLLKTMMIISIILIINIPFIQPIRELLSKNLSLTCLFIKSIKNLKTLHKYLFYKLYFKSEEFIYHNKKLEIIFVIYNSSSVDTECPIICCKLYSKNHKFSKTYILIREDTIIEGKKDKKINFFLKIPNEMNDLSISYKTINQFE